MKRRTKKKRTNRAKKTFRTIVKKISGLTKIERQKLFTKLKKENCLAGYRP